MGYCRDLFEKDITDCKSCSVTRYKCKKSTLCFQHVIHSESHGRVNHLLWTSYTDRMVHTYHVITVKCWVPARTLDQCYVVSGFYVSIKTPSVEQCRCPWWTIDQVQL